MMIGLWLLLALTLGESYVLFPNGSVQYLEDQPHTSLECCFDQLPEVPSLLLPTTSEFCFEEALLDEIMLLEFHRNDSLPFWDFDLSADKAILRTSEQYPFHRRYLHITKQAVDLTNFLNQSALANSSVRTTAYACGQLPGSPSLSKSDDVFCVVSPQTKLPLVFQTRVPIATTEIIMITGSALLLVTPPERVRSLKSFAVVHALRYQSQLDFTNSTTVPAYFIPLNVGDKITLPSYYSYRLVVLEESSRWITYRTENNTMQHARTKAMETFPILLQPNALREQPVFFGMWALALWADDLFAFVGHAPDRIKSPLLQVAKQRWGQASVRVGHADDPADLALQAMEIQTYVTEECQAMKMVAKDLMLNDREQYKKELAKSSQKVRRLLRDQIQVKDDGKDSEAFYEFGMDLFEIAICLFSSPHPMPFQQTQPGLLFADFTSEVKQDYAWRQQVSFPISDEFSAQQIIPRLFLGGIDAAMDHTNLGLLGISHVLTVADELVEFSPSGNPSAVIKHHAVIPVFDTEDDVLLVYFDQALEYIHHCLTEPGRAVLVHCVAGVSRSATVVIAYLMKHHGMPLSVALAHTRQVRNVVQPNDGFMFQLDLFQHCRCDCVEAMNQYQVLCETN
ncbi:hypothetical protein BASA81_001747 [Batrachochytrium salamandrivorans]|nr:hypothetical protein BASA81_001747 [Batrachochytrium salamandrivorans]